MTIDKKLMNRLGELQQRLGVIPAAGYVATRAAAEALKAMSLEDLDLLLALSRGDGEPTPDSEAALGRYLRACADATIRLTATPSMAPTASPKTSRQRRPRPGLPRYIDLSSEKARRLFREFVEQGWSVLEPDTPFVPGVHVDAVCQHLQAVANGRIKNLIINIPPGHAKSLLTAVFWPAWVWIDHPETRWIFASHNMELAIRDSVRCRRLIESPWYQRRWGGRFRLSHDQNQKGRFEHSLTGYRLVTSVGSGTGERADIVVVDDPTTVDQAASDVARKAANDWWTGTMLTRVNDLRTGHLVVVQQRLHEGDLTGTLLEKGGYELLVLPEEYEPERACCTSIGWRDPRTTPGELLWPEKIGPAEVERLKRDLGSYYYAAQYMQRPSPASGGIFKRYYFRYWQLPFMELQAVIVRGADGEPLKIVPVNLPDEFDMIIQSWDMAYKSAEDSDYVVGAVWGIKGADRFLIHQVRGRWSFPQTLKQLRDMHAKYPNAVTILIEDKANGPAVIDTLRHEIPGLVAVNPEGGKIARAQAVSGYVEAGNVYLPHPSLAPWVEDFVEECAAFPKGRHDDQVDQMTQALLRLQPRPPVKLVSVPDNWYSRYPDGNAWMAF